MIPDFISIYSISLFYAQKSPITFVEEIVSVNSVPLPPTLIFLEYNPPGVFVGSKVCMSKYTSLTPTLRH